MTNSAKAATARAVDATEVAAFLAENPGFFNDYPDLASQLAIPTGEGTISLVERRQAMLQTQADQAQQRLDEFVKSAHANNEIFEKCRRLVLALLAAENSEDFFKAMEASFRDDFQCVAYQLSIFSDTPHQVNHFTTCVSESAAAEYVGGLLKARKPTLGVLRESEQDFLFRHQSAEVRSAAVVPVRKNRRIGLLALGSADTHYFQAGMGTLFIGFIADVLAQLIPRYVYLKHQ